MSNLVIVAIPHPDDYVWKISTEKIPHMTLLYLGEAASVDNIEKITEFLEHASTTMLSPFYMDVDDRGTLGKDDADVLFFDDSWDLPHIVNFRSVLLRNDSVKMAYESAERHPEWRPHLTLGYPTRPAKKDDREYPGINSVRFNRIALWTGDFEGPEFKLKHDKFYGLAEVSMSGVKNVGADAVDEFLAHFGIKGMRWGVRNQKNKTASVTIDGKTKLVTPKKAAKLDAKWEKNQFTLDKGIERHNAMAEHFNSRIGALNDKYHDHDFSKETFDNPATWSPKFKDYNKEIMSLNEASFRHAVAEIHTPSPTGKKTVEVVGDIHKDTMRIEVKNAGVTHADNEIIDEVFVFSLKRNAKGLVTNASPSGNSIAQASDFVENFIQHYGVKGMKWGVRKNNIPTEVSVKQKGKKLKSGGGKGHAPHEDAVKAATASQKARASGLHALSNDELQQLVTRKNLEQQAVRLQSGDKKGAKAFVKEVLRDVGKQQVKRAANEVATRKVDKLIKKNQ